MNFYKYQGTGNDFIMIDNRDLSFPQEDVDYIAQLCDRRFGIGADGLILIQDKEGYDFEMVYFNADGRTSSMCGNGGRCIVAFAKHLGVIENKAYFLAIDGAHEAIVDEKYWVELKMQNVENIVQYHGENIYIMNTGSPHYVQFVHNMMSVNVYEDGRKIRYSKPFKKEGINVNFVEEVGEGINVTTYERGVEDETFSCGTGVTACAISTYLKNKVLNKTLTNIPIQTKGGKLMVRFEVKEEDSFENIWLCGEAIFVFEGKV